MKVEERIAIIQNKAKQDAEEKLIARNKEEERRVELITQVQALSDRIETVITLANVCVKNGVEIPKDSSWSQKYDSGKPYGYSHEFIAEGITHHTGLIRTWGESQKGLYKYIGIENGGWCGVYDFWTDGYEVCAVRGNNREDKKLPRIRDMVDFLNEFPQFERAFLNWVDSMKQ